MPVHSAHFDVAVRDDRGARQVGVQAAELIANVTQEERGVDRVRVELLARCLAGIEPPTAGRLDRIVRSALHRGKNDAAWRSICEVSA